MKIISEFIQLLSLSIWHMMQKNSNVEAQKLMSEIRAPKSTRVRHPNDWRVRSELWVQNVCVGVCMHVEYVFPAPHSKYFLLIFFIVVLSLFPIEIKLNFQSRSILK